jgi:hypothetical protein
LRECHRSEVNAYSNELHDVLLCRDKIAFWRSWTSKFEPSYSSDYVVEGSSDPVVGADSLFNHFRSVLEVNPDVAGVKKVKRVFGIDLALTWVAFVVATFSST